jgi:hypothetical protein
MFHVSRVPGDAMNPERDGGSCLAGLIDADNGQA